MTALELENTLLRLGCNAFASEDFSYIATTALRRIYNDVPITKRGAIYAHGLLPTSVRKGIYHKAGANVSYPLVGKAFSVRVCGGTPKVVVNTGSVTTTHILSNGSSTLKGFIYDNMGIISFIGDYDYYIENLCLFDQSYTSDKSEIPDGGEFTVYNVTKYLTDFMAFASALTDINGNPIEQATANGNIISVNADFKGEIFFEYRKGPLYPIEYDMQEIIDLPDEYEMLLPILCLAYYFAEVDTNRSELYMEQYEGLLNSVLERLGSGYTPPKVQDLSADYTICDGWA